MRSILDRYMDLFLDLICVDLGTLYPSYNRSIYILICQIKNPSGRLDMEGSLLLFCK